MLPSWECYRDGILPDIHQSLLWLYSFLTPAPTEPRRPCQNTEFFLKDTGTAPSLLPFLWVSPLSALEPELGQLYDLLRLREHLAKMMQGETGKPPLSCPESSMERGQARLFEPQPSGPLSKDPDMWVRLL